MSNYATLKAAVMEVVKSNGNKEITGTNMQSTLLGMIDSLASGYLFKGVATPSTTHATPDENVFYIGAAGTYANFGTSVTIPEGSIGVFMYNGSWTKSQVKLFDVAVASDFDNPDSTKRAKIPTVGAILDGFVGDGVYDVSARNGGATFASLEALLSNENLATLIPTQYRHGGMEMRFVHTSDNKYVQARLMADEFTTDVTQWQGVDDEPVAGSDNLVKSGGVNSHLFNNFFIGKGNDYTSVTIKGLRGGNKYRIYFQDENWSMSGITVTGVYRFTINSFNNEEQTTLVAVGITGTPLPYYDITIPSNSDYIVIGGRASIGEIVRFVLIDTTYMEEQLTKYPEITTGNDADLSITDNNNKILVIFEHGEVRTLNFNSAETPSIQRTDEDGLTIQDEKGNAIVSFSNRGVKTAMFSSDNIEKRLLFLENDAVVIGKGLYVGELIKIGGYRYSSSVWNEFANLPATQSFATYGDYIIFLYGAPNYGTGSIWQISTKTKLSDITLPHGNYQAPHSNVCNFSKTFAQDNVDLPLLYVSQWDNEGGCFVYDIRIDGTCNLIQTIMPDNNMGDYFGSTLGDWVLDNENGVIYSVKYKLGAYHEAGNALMFCKFNIPFTENSNVVLSESDIKGHFSISAETADLTVTQDKIINGSKMYIPCGFGSGSSYPSYPAKLFVVDLLGQRVSSFVDIDKINNGEPEGVDIVDNNLLIMYSNKIYQLIF